MGLREVVFEGWAGNAEVFLMFGAVEARVAVREEGADEKVGRARRTVETVFLRVVDAGEEVGHLTEDPFNWYADFAHEFIERGLRWRPVPVPMRDLQAGVAVIVP